MKNTAPTKEQTAEMAKVTQQVGGVRPLHMKNFNKIAENEPVETETKTEENTEKKPNNFEFPEGGWECSKCQNYNFKGRKACFRCKKQKSDDDNEGKPEHMNVQPKPRRNKKAKEEVSNDSTYEYSKDNRVHKYKAGGQSHHKDHNQERVGDWTCQRCFNHNFSFREVCNMCYLSHTESNKMLY
jgi:hypothetical protein